MTKTCRLCRQTAQSEDCYVRLEATDHPACRACWEQLFLDPRRVLRSLAAGPIDRVLPGFDAPAN